ncbi:IucA/IucC family protein, partial [Streptomyces sp. NPDC127074]|uniref:IucA/IucC family protein n=1 Tax=Streptomyces sp. NPDC127074 TaxID=3347130 RepID=UPI003655D2CE
MTEEEELLGRVLDTLLREDAYKLRSRATPERRADGDWLRIALEGGESVLLPVEPEGFQCDIRARRRPLRLCAPATAGWAPTEPAPAERTPAEPAPAEPAPAERTSAEPGDAEPPSASGSAGESGDCVPAERPLTGLVPVLGRLRAAVPDEDRPLYDVFVTECRQALDAMRLHTRIRPGVVAELAVRHGGEGRWAGMPGAVAYDTLAAFRDHPVYPTSRGRAVFTEDQLRAHAPEFHPTFPLRWLVLPREAVGGDPARLPDWWPTPAQLGLDSGRRPSRARGRQAVPVPGLPGGRPRAGARGRPRA